MLVRILNIDILILLDTYMDCLAGPTGGPKGNATANPVAVRGGGGSDGKLAKGLARRTGADSLHARLTGPAAGSGQRRRPTHARFDDVAAPAAVRARLARRRRLRDGLLRVAGRRVGNGR